MSPRGTSRFRPCAPSRSKCGLAGSENPRRRGDASEIPIAADLFPFYCNDRSQALWLEGERRVQAGEGAEQLAGRAVVAGRGELFWIERVAVSAARARFAVQ